MWRIKDDEMEFFIGVRQGPEIGNGIRRNPKYSAVAKYMLFTSDVAIQYQRILLVEVEHAATTTWIQYLREGAHSNPRRYACQ